MGGLRIGYARVSTDEQDLAAQRDALLSMGVAPDRVYVDHGLTGTNRERPGLRQALAACRAGDTLVVTKLDRLARSLPDARAIADELTAESIKLDLGGAVYDPTDPIGRLLFNVLAMVAEFSVIWTDAGGRKPKLTPRQARIAQEMYDAGEYTVAQIAAEFGVSRPTIYRHLARLAASDVQTEASGGQ